MGTFLSQLFGQSFGAGRDAVTFQNRQTSRHHRKIAGMLAQADGDGAQEQIAVMHRQQCCGLSDIRHLVVAQS
jgi:hypothetical protein